MRFPATLVIAAFLAASTPVFARSGGHTGHHNSNYAQGVQRDSSGKIARSSPAKREFIKANPCPSGVSGGGCSGYVVDHVVPLKRGGADDPSNMQWQTEGEARAKDRWE